MRESITNTRLADRIFICMDYAFMQGKPSGIPLLLSNIDLWCTLGREALRFRGGNIQEYAIAKGRPESLSSFTICFWFNASNHLGSLLSYAYTWPKNTVESNGILFYINNHGYHVTSRGLQCEFNLAGSTKVKNIRYRSLLNKLLLHEYMNITPPPPPPNYRD